MSTRVENINRDIIEWAILRNGMDPTEFYTLNPKVKKWITGELYPTVKQLEDFTHKVHVPFGYLFLSTPPNEEVEIPFFRTGSYTTKDVSLNLYHTIQIIQDRQNWLSDYLDELGFEDLNFVGKYDVNINHQQVVADIRETLKLSYDWASKFNNWESALDHLTSQIEEVGIVVTFNGIVGTNTRRKISVDECRGFVLVNKKVPFLFINSSDAKAAQMFTIMHELAHVWLGESAGFDNKNLLPADHPIEVLCDKVAAEILVPEIFFLEKWKITQNYSSLSRLFKVSQIVIARRAMDLGLINREDFFSFYNEYISDIKEKQLLQTPGGNFYATAKKRVSLRFASFVNNAVRENKLLYRDAYRLTNLKGETYNKFITEYLY